MSLSGEKLKECIDKFLIHSEHVAKTVYKLGEMSSFLRKGDIKTVESIYGELNETEKKADAFKREVISLINVPFIDARDREDILMLMDKIEEIASHAKSASKLIVLINRLNVSVEDKLAESITTMIGKSVEAMRELIKVIRNIGEPLELFSDGFTSIKHLEEEIDELRFEALSKLFTKCVDEIDVGCIIVKDLIDEVEKISDICEDICDLVRLISLSK